ncbi:hypothetical protein FACS189472_13780 [Alphaproteobacteria bacterium]|nr:hypothetical protein FACS189472_13780 [Alphaproteobacteria bacterium]
MKSKYSAHDFLDYYLQDYDYSGVVTAGEFSVLFGILPSPLNEWDAEKEELLNGSLDFFLQILNGYDEKSVIRTYFFGSSEIAEMDLLNWLFVLFKGYKSVEVKVKEKIAAVLAQFHRYPDTRFPKKMEIILPLLMNFFESFLQPCSKKEMEQAYMKVSALSYMSTCIYNKSVLIDGGVVSSLIPLIGKDCSCSKLLSLVCQTNSFEHKNKIIDTPNFLTKATCFLKQTLLLDETVSDKDYRFYWLRNVLLSLGMLCCSYDTSEDYGMRRKEDVNEYALQQCTVYGIPLLGFRVVSEVYPRLKWFEGCMSIAASSLLSLFVDGSFRADGMACAALKQAVDCVVNLKGDSRVLPNEAFDVLFYFVCLAGECATPHLFMRGVAEDALEWLECIRNSFLHYLWTESCVLHVCHVLCCVCVYGSMLTAAKEDNALAGVVREHGGVDTLLAIEEILLDEELNGGNDDWKLTLLQKVRSKIYLCLCHLFKK